MSVEEIEDVDRLKRINRALMSRVESAMDQHGNAFSLFQTAINLEGQVKRRTDELTIAVRGLEKINLELERAKEASEIANLSKTRFLAAASHDVLQPLNAALLSISVLADIQETPLGKDLAQQVERSLDTMNELLKILLDISKLDAGIVEPLIDNFPLDSILDDLRSDFTPIAEEKKLDLRIKNSSAFITSDRTMLRRILQNLISNALRYTSKGGVLVGCRIREKEILIEVVDTGSGIPPEQQEQVFEEFHRGALPRGHDRDGQSGMGLGLSIVKRMATALNHDLLLTSRVGRGTRFRLSVPHINDIEYHDTQNQESVFTGPTNLNGINILLIENDPASIDASVKLFKRWGCDTKVASTINETMQLLKDADWMPDILVADLHLDHGDLGTDAVAKARTHLGKDVPALVITADPTNSLEEKISKQKMELMYKPVKPAQLRALISHLLQ